MKVKKNGVLVEIPVDEESIRIVEARRRARLLGTTRRSQEEIDKINAGRDENGRFLPGTSGLPGGSVRRAREDRYFIDALKSVFEGLGGVHGMLAWAKNHPTKFYEICSKMMPVQLQIEKEQGTNTVFIKHALPPPRY